MVLSLLLFVLVFAFVAGDTNSVERVYVCSCGDSSFLGEYTISLDEMMDGVPSYTSKQGKSIFRNNGFWYVGDVHQWPLQTHYRCVGHIDCPMRSEVPPIPGSWTVNKAVGKAPSPELQSTPCIAKEEL